MQLLMATIKNMSHRTVERAVDMSEILNGRYLMRVGCCMGIMMKKGYINYCVCQQIGDDKSMILNIKEFVPEK